MNALRRVTGCLAAALTLLLSAWPSLAESGARFAVVRDTSSLNVRSGPGTGYGWLGRVPRGGWVEVIGQQPGWFLCRVVGSPLEGYMSANYLSGAWASSSTAVVNNPGASQYLNLRLYPSYSAPVLGTFRNGAVCTVLSESAGWYHVEIEGLRGYFRGEYLRFTDGGPTGETAEVHSQNGGKVNLRAGPAYAYPVTGRYAPGARAAVLLKGNVFWQISVGGASGFMDSNFLRCGPSPEPGGAVWNAFVTDTGVPLLLREQPSTSSRALGRYAGNTRLIVREQGSQWCRVKVLSDGREGYMMTAFLTLAGLPEVPVRIVRHPDGAYVNLRSSPSLSAPVRARVPHGGVVAVIAPGGDWTKLSYGSETGYMMSSFLR